MDASPMPIFRPAGGSGSDIFRPPSSNQYFPMMPSMSSPSSPNTGMGGGGMPGTPGGSGGTGFDMSQFNWSGFNPAAQSGNFFNKGSGVASEPTQYPHLSQNWAEYLKSQMGQGTPANPLLQQLMQFFSGGQSNMPGANTLSTIANQGISALPEWQSMIQAQQQNIGQNQANLREQFAGMGDLAGSPFGTAMSNFAQQTTLDENSLLAQLQQQNILQGQIPVAENLMGGANQMGMFGQSLLPQNNPLNQFMEQMATTYGPMYQTKKGGGILGGLMPSIMGAAGGGIAAGAGGGGASEIIMAMLAGMCHVAASFWGWDDPRTKKVQWYMITQADPKLAMFYLRNGWWIAKTDLRWKFKPLFDSILGVA
jgi:hypothetical protein